MDDSNLGLRGYDRVAEQYATEFFEELKRKPCDRQLLDQFAESVSGTGAVCEFECGPGQVARYLREVVKLPQGS